MSDLAPLSAPTQPLTTLADAEHALGVIVVAEAAETLWARAKNPERLYDAVQAKLTNQAAYAVWRPSVSPAHRPKSPSERKDLLPAADPGEQVVRRWRQRLVGEGKMAAALVDAQSRCVRICEQEAAPNRQSPNTGEYEWYTPAEYIAAARQVMGGIDLDPASHPVAQETVQATTYYTAEDDGLQQPWNGRVWLNPPYSQPLIGQFIDKLAAELRAGRVSQAIMVTNNCTDTEWFHAAVKADPIMCFPRGRIRFANPTKPAGESPLQGQCFFYYAPNQLYAPNRVAFCRAFSAFGFIVGPLEWEP